MTRRRATRASSLLAGVCALSVALTGCLFAPQSGTAATSTPADPSGIAADLLPFYTQEVAWTGCGEFQCATVTAPLDWQQLSVGEIELSVVRKVASGSERIGSLLTNPGGPGASGVDLVKNSIDVAVGKAILESYDVIGFDPRGVGKSTAVTCLDDAGMDVSIFDIPPGERGSEEWNAWSREQTQLLVDACDENSGGILPFVTTEQAARDLDLLRGVLGDDTLNFLGYSYGTFLGATYAELFPERVGRLVLDGAVDPTTSSSDVSVTQGEGFESALRAFMETCLAGSDCAFNGTVDDAMADLGTMLARVDRDPLPNKDGRELGADALLTGIVAALYSQGSWPYLAQGLKAVTQGNPSVMFQLADFYYNRSDGKYLDNSTEAFMAYNCMDYPAVTAEERANAAAALSAVAPTIAAYWQSDDSACDFWPYPPTGTRSALHAAGAAPIVVVGTTNDPATPYSWSVALAEQLESAVLITRVGEGHTGYNKGNTCVDTAVEKYLLKGVAPAKDIRCE